MLHFSTSNLGIKVATLFVTLQLRMCNFHNKLVFWGIYGCTQIFKNKLEKL